MLSRAFVLLLAFAACTPTNGKDGTNGTNGTNGFNALVKVLNEPSGANCASGGQRIQTGLDDGSGGGTAGNGTLESGEVDDTVFVCNGADGTDGTNGVNGTNGTNGTNGSSSLVRVVGEPAGMNCPVGGSRIESGLDDGAGGGVAGDGMLQTGEVDSTAYVCSGVSALVNVTTEAPGMGCTAGGQRIERGLDDGDGGGTAGNGVLEGGEVDSSALVCNGVTPTGSLIAVVAEAAGANCANGGSRLDVGLDDGAGGGTANDGVLQPGEVDTTRFVCNSVNGFTTLLRLTGESAGANCANGGQRIDQGLDNGDGGGTARNGTLEAGEIDGTTYLCALVAPLCDNFNVPNSTTITGWTERIGDWSIDTNRLRDTTVGSVYSHHITMNGSTQGDGCVRMTAIHSGAAGGVTAVGAVLRWNSPTSFIVALVQDNSSGGTFNSAWLYEYPGPNSIGPVNFSAFGTSPNIEACVTGAAVTFRIDAARDGTYETTLNGTTTVLGSGLSGVMMNSFNGATGFADNFCWGR